PCKVGNGDASSHQLMQAAPRQVGLAADQLEEVSQLLIVLQGSPVSPVEVRHLIESEIFERQPGTNIERGLVDVGDEKMRFGGVSDGQGQARQRAGGLKGAPVVPGAEQSEHFAAEAAREKPVHLVQSSHQGGRDFAQNLLLDEDFEIEIGTGLGVPVLQCPRIQLKVAVERGRESSEQRFSRLEVGGVEHLEVSHNHFPALLACLL